MASAPRFSVAIPAYNAAQTLEETVASVQAQSFDDFEIVICNDGSTDGTLDLAERLAAADPRVRVVTQDNRGSGGAYNTAVRAARASLIVMLSADDLLLPEHMATYDRVVREHPEASVFSSDGFYLYDDGAREPAHANAGWADPESCSISDLLRACIMGVGAVYRREVFDAVGGYREDLYAEDYPFWLFALAKGYQHRFIDTPLAIHRRNAVQKSASAIRVRQAERTAVQLVLDSGLLSAVDRQVARSSLRSTTAKILLWRALTAVAGEGGATRIVDRLRGRQRPQAS